MDNLNKVLDKTKVTELITAAFGAREHSYSPYSNYMVGAALLGKSGKIYTGCNVESATYSPTNCAERTAIFKAISEGENEFSAIAVVGGKRGTKIGEFGIASPCGVCRQVLAEFCDLVEFSVIMAKSASDYKIMALGELLPESFVLER